MALFLSTHDNKMDAKGRVSVPAPFRKVLARADNGLILYPSPDKHCLIGCTEERMEFIAETIDQMDQNSEEAAVYMQLMASAHPANIDSDGRIMLSASLIAYAGLSAAVTFTGVGRDFQIWDTAQYDDYSAKIKSSTAFKQTQIRMSKPQHKEGS